MTMRRQFSLFLVCAISAIALSGAPAKRGVTAEDYFAFQSAGDPRLSPDGKLVAFVVTTIDQARNRRDNSIWVVSTDGQSAPRRLTAEGVNSSSPRWSPDGSRLAFLSSRASQPPASAAPSTAATPAEPPRPQICILPMSGGEAQVLTHLKNAASAIEWSPDGKRLVAVSQTGPSDNPPPAGRPSDVRHYSHILYNFNDTGWYDDKRSHIFVIDASSGAAAQITSGDDWNDTDPQWSPDSTRIAFVSDRTGHEFDDSHAKNIWVIPAEGGTLVRISDHEFGDTQPRWSPDGAEIAFTGEAEKRIFPKLYLASSAGGGKPRLAADDIDLIPGALRWGPGARELSFEAGVKGNAAFVSRRSGRAQDHPGHPRRAGGPRRGRQPEAGAMVYLANDFSTLDDLYVSALDGSAERQLTH
jgi:dipeptidyl aminopeptidase/acylaminoacyl peptidase